MYEDRDMRAIGDFRKLRRCDRGFTLLELILVIGISALFLGLTLPAGLSFYQRSVADEGGRELVALLRGAGEKAALGKNDRAFGVKFFADRAVVFQGPSFVTRIETEDVVFPFVAGTVISGMSDEILFAKQTGVPSETGVLTVSLYGTDHHLRISQYGMIEYVD